MLYFPYMMREGVAMSYCSKCGSYIPDSALVCPACGKPKIGAAETAQQQAQQSRQGTQSYSYGKATNRETAEKKYSYRKTEESGTKREGTTTTTYQRTTYHYGNESSADEHAYEDFDTSVENENGENNLIAALGYLGPLVLLPLLTKPNSPYVRFHANQSLALLIFYIACNVAAVVPVVGWIASVFGQFFGIYGLIKGMRSALSGKMEKLPIIGDLQILGNKRR